MSWKSLRRLAHIFVVLALAASFGAASASAAEPIRNDVNDFTFDSFEAHYELSRDAEGRSVLQTTEHIVARFPDFDQNRGFIRDLPRRYDGHETELEVLSVTDETGTPRPYSVEASGDFVSVTMAVPEGSFVHGQQSYVLKYREHDVTRYFADTGVDEFYRDINGTGWSQPFGRVSARLTLAEDLVPQFTGAASCYRGFYGSTQGCELRTEGTSILSEELNLGPSESVTIAVAFAEGTFNPPPVPFFERVPILLYAGFASLGGAILLIVFSVVSGLRGKRTGRAIIAQYDPPAGLSAATSAALLKKSGKAMTATLLDFAVRRNIRLLHDEPSDVYGAQALSSEGLLPIEDAAYHAIFRSSAPNSSTWFERKSTRLGDAAAQLRSRAHAELRSLGYIKRVSGWLIGGVVLLFVLALLLPVLHSIVTRNFTLMTILLAVGINVIVWVLLFTIAGLGALKPRTIHGAMLHDHLMGLKEYIRLAESDRIRMLQSASGAEVDDQRIVQVYERLLPYAVIFGYEDEWQAELAKYYHESSPGWVAGTSAPFSTGFPLRSFQSSVATSRVTASSSSSGSRSSFSSSSGGSSGGGFSGGGGGGGGGRGI